MELDCSCKGGQLLVKWPEVVVVQDYFNHRSTSEEVFNAIKMILHDYNFNILTCKIVLSSVAYVVGGGCISEGGSHPVCIAHSCR